MSLFAGGKRRTVAAWMVKTGLEGALARLLRRDCLIVINYHRIGMAIESPWDAGVFSATPAEFDEQLSWLKRRFQLIGLEEAIAFVHGETSWPGTSILLTFDDGYRDNYESAFPILRAHGAWAAFFLPTSFVGTCKVPLWDAVAYQLHKTRRASLRLNYPVPLEISFDTTLHAALRRVQDLYKLPGTDPRRLTVEIEQATGVELPATSSERLFMSWAEASEMAEAGMGFGSHTDSHEMVSRMSAERQLAEFRCSRAILAERLRVPADALAFPFGGRDSFDEHTAECLRAAGYRAGFSFYGGVNLRGRTNAFDIRRIDGDLDEGMPVFQVKTAIAAMTGLAFF